MLSHTLRHSKPTPVPAQALFTLNLQNFTMTFIAWSDLKCSHHMLETTSSGHTSLLYCKKK